MDLVYPTGSRIWRDWRVPALVVEYDGFSEGEQQGARPCDLGLLCSLHLRMEQAQMPELLVSVREASELRPLVPGFQLVLRSSGGEMSLGLKRRHKERIDSKQHIPQHSEN